MESRGNSDAAHTYIPTYSTYVPHETPLFHYCNCVSNCSVQCVIKARNAVITVST